MNIETPYPALDGTQACAEYDPELFFPDSNEGLSRYRLTGGVHPAVSVCRRCPFIRPCLAYAITHDVSGIWGGTFESERDRLRQKAGIRADRGGLNQPHSNTNGGSRDH